MQTHHPAEIPTDTESGPSNIIRKLHRTGRRTSRIVKPSSRPSQNRNAGLSVQLQRNVWAGIFRVAKTAGNQAWCRVGCGKISVSMNTMIGLQLIGSMQQWIRVDGSMNCEISELVYFGWSSVEPEAEQSAGSRSYKMEHDNIIQLNCLFNST